MNNDRIADIRARCNNAKEIGLTGPHMAAAVFDAYCEDIPYLLEQLGKAEVEVDRLSQLAMMREAEIGDRDREIERLRETQRWVPVSEKLPERNEKILAYTPPEPGYAELYEATRGYMARLGHRTGITHWRPFSGMTLEEGESK